MRYAKRAQRNKSIDEYNGKQKNVNHFLNVLSRGVGGTTDTNGLSGSQCAEVHQAIDGIRGTEKLTDR